MKTVAQFAIDYHQYINEKGQLQIAPDLDCLSQTKDLVALYRWMVITRIFDHKAIALQRTGKMGTYASILGQEAISVALGRAMSTEDVMCPAYREYGAYLQRGVTMAHILQYWGGDERGSAARESVDLPICVPIATQCLHAVGVAKAFMLQKKKHVAVSVCGDGATSQGDFYEAINVATTWNLPVVFVVNNNQWAISVPLAKQTVTQTLAQKGIAAQMKALQVDGNDAIALYDQFSQALTRAREGLGPTLIEAMSYRLCDHTTADDASRYRPEEELQAAWEREPITRLKIYLESVNAWDEQKEQALQEEAQQLVQDAVTQYLDTIPQPATAMLDYLYEKLPDALACQYTELLQYGDPAHD